MPWILSIAVRASVRALTFWRVPSLALSIAPAWLWRIRNTSALHHPPSSHSFTLTFSILSTCPGRVCVSASASCDERRCLIASLLNPLFSFLLQATSVTCLLHTRLLYHNQDPVTPATALSSSSPSSPIALRVPSLLERPSKPASNALPAGPRCCGPLPRSPALPRTSLQPTTTTRPPARTHALSSCELLQPAPKEPTVRTGTHRQSKSSDVFHTKLRQQACIKGVTLYTSTRFT